MRLGFVLSSIVYDNAVKKDDLRILEWLKRCNCPWDEDTFAAAAEHSRLEILKWLKENGCP
jgi:hypothetical protein